ncbi:BadF/BadG/BcrA/BcrD ATPase family protein [Bacillus sp. 31A1R]|uniref:BadF/BadG/BcrA/BcrD ATPase family protein n=1 Tax=Robertmurraya mangrovi TaxID=3098077 RepID=A0ABU5J2P9_9BACI|nr:BadF/BadG/BcrA/BcrD ATPase family protein [Bacillus sp. 31A1R]MDZ5473698.1 BadF/BadG/BcrA/BcrD ATPase family protein [Bacillus sp. 31A1R]
MYVLGIDGGGTKTIGVIADESGTVVAISIVGATNQNGVDLERVKQEFQLLFQDLKNQNQEVFDSITHVFAGMSGVDRESAKANINEMISFFVPNNVSVFIDNDGVNALFAGTLGDLGIVQIGGTGSISFGMNETGIHSRVGGWGYLIDDEISGFALGKEALRAAFAESDQRGGKTLLTPFILKHFQTESISEVIPYIYQLGMSRDVIAPLGKLVIEAADEGDSVAKTIIYELSMRTAFSISTLIKRLFPNQDRRIPVVLAGGIYKRAEWFSPIILEGLAQQDISADLIEPLLPPVGGAVIAALKQAGADINQTFVQTFIETNKYF